MVANLPLNIGEREISVVKEKMRIENSEVVIVENSPGPGNIVTIETEFENITEVFTGFGEKGVSAERVASNVCKLARDYISSGACVGKYLADQLLVPIAIAGGGKYTTVSPSRHTITNIEIIKKFLDLDIKTEQLSEKIYEIEVG